MPKFKVGDRVTRLRDVFKPLSELRRGKVVRCYSRIRCREYPELYEVLWDDGQLEEGFLPHGLNADPR